MIFMSMIFEDFLGEISGVIIRGNLCPGMLSIFWGNFWGHVLRIFMSTIFKDFLGRFQGTIPDGIFCPGLLSIFWRKF